MEDESFFIRCGRDSRLLVDSDTDGFSPALVAVYRSIWTELSQDERHGQEKF